MSYLQINGQPTDNTKWNQQNLFLPFLKEKDDNDNWIIISSEKLQKEYNLDWRIFARSTSDSKGPTMSFISVLQILQRQIIKPAYNIKVIMGFQEEMGSPSLPDVISQNRHAPCPWVRWGTTHETTEKPS